MDKQGVSNEKQTIDSIVKGFGPFTSLPPPLPPYNNHTYQQIPEQQQRINDTARKKVPPQKQQSLYSIYLVERSTPQSSVEPTSKGLMVESVGESVDGGGVFSPWSGNNQECNKEAFPTMMEVVPTLPRNHQIQQQLAQCSDFGCTDASKAIVVREEAPSEAVQIMVKGATSHKCDPGFPFKVFKGSDFKELYSACAIDLHYKVHDIFLMLEKVEGSRVKQTIINEDDKVSNVPVWEGAIITIHAYDGCRNVHPRFIELKCSIDRPEGKKITKKLKFLPTTKLINIKEWCAHIQREPETTYILVFSSMHGEAGSLTLQSAMVKNGVTLRTGSLVYLDYPG